MNKLDNKLISAILEHATLDEVKLLLENGADIHAHDDEALLWASLNGHVDMVKLLLENGANINSWDDAALRGVEENGNLNIVALIKLNKLKNY